MLLPALSIPKPKDSRIKVLLADLLNDGQRVLMEGDFFVLNGLNMLFLLNAFVFMLVFLLSSPSLYLQAFVVFQLKNSGSIVYLLGLVMLSIR